MAGDIINGDFTQGGTGWTTVIINGGTGGVAYAGGTAKITGPDGAAGGGYVEIFQNITNPQPTPPDKVIQFDMVSYTTVDTGYTPAFDSPYISVNGAGYGMNENGTLVAGLTPGSGTQNGYGNVGEGDGQASNVHYSLTVPNGCLTQQRLAFGVDSADNLFGPGILTLDNVTSDCVPEPTTVGLLALGALALIRRR